MNEFENIGRTFVYCLFGFITLYYFIKKYFEDKVQARKHQAEENQKDRDAREKENVANMKTLFDQMYDAKHSKMINEFQSLTQELKLFYERTSNRLSEYNSQTSEKLLEFLQNLK